MTRKEFKDMLRKWRTQRRKNGSWVSGWMTGALSEFSPSRELEDGYKWISRVRRDRFVAIQLRMNREKDGLPF